VTLQHPVAHWLSAFEAAGLPTAKVQDMAQVLQDPQLLARHMVLPVAAQPDGPAFTAPGNPIKISTLPEITARPPAPRLDGDRAAVLAWLDGGT
jgi:CoA:oxalate CoA-transferase